MKTAKITGQDDTHAFVEFSEENIVTMEAKIPLDHLQKNMETWVKLGWSTISDKVKAVEIHIDRAEGPTRLCGSRSFFGPDCWTMAHAHLCEMAKTAPAKGGYDKHDFKVVFADGETYEGRYDLVHLNKQTPDLPGHIRNFLQFLTGDFCPSHLKQADYDRCTENQTTREEAKAFLKKYQIG